MLTSDLARYEFVGQEVRPKYITRKEAPVYLPIAASIIDLLNANIGRERAKIDEELGSIERQADFKVVRGLAKLASDECVYEPQSNLDFRALRSNVFDAAQRRYPLVTSVDLLHQADRTQIFREIAEEVALDPVRLETLLFGDLPHRRVLKAVEKPFTPETLLQRYNLAQAQALLYWAKELYLTISGDYKVVWKYVKLARLIHELEKAPEGYRIRLVGPMSVFHHWRRYGIRLAMFLPGLLLAERFSMVATVSIHGAERQFRLDEQSGLHSPYRESRHPFDSTLEEKFFQQFSAAGTDWSIEREGQIIDLGDTVMIPDFTLTHRNGRHAFLEIVGYWTPDYLEKKLNKISRVNIPNLIIAHNESLNCERLSAKIPASPHVVRFKSVLKVKDILSCLNALA